VAKKRTGKKTAKKAADRGGAGEPSLQTAHSVIPGIAPYKPRKGEEYMNEAQREHFREILLAWRSQLVSDITRTINSMQDESINHPDPTDRATQETDMSLELRSRDRERKLIKKIDDTIERIDEDDYGYCDNCGVEIGIARLEARPTATLCIDCKTLDEIRERQMV
jgi:DnaK suppressor protein